MSIDGALFFGGEHVAVSIFINRQSTIENRQLKMDRNSVCHIVRNRTMIIGHLLEQINYELGQMEEGLKEESVHLPEYIMLHHSLTPDGETVSWGAIRRYHISWAYQGVIISEQQGKRLQAEGKDVKEPWDDIGYHYGIELVGDHCEILTGRMLTETGAHCPQQNMNTNSVGICFVGNFDKAEPPAAQWDLGIKLVKSLMAVLGIPAVSVHGHREYAPYKSCPGKQFDLDKFRGAL